MGFNIAGLVINNNYDKDITQLEEDIHIGLEVVRESTFEDACSNWKEDGMYHVYFGDKGTMIFYGHEMAIEHNLSKRHESMSYAYSATAMAFYISYNNLADSQYREIMESEGDRNMDEGAPIPLEADHPTADGLTFALMDKIMEQNWHSIDFGEKCYVCKPKRYQAPSSTSNSSIATAQPNEEKVVVATPQPLMQKKKKEESPKTERVITNNDESSKTEKVITKKWWEFWK